jgi:hypothetical protein
MPHLGFEFEVVTINKKTNKMLILNEVKQELLKLKDDIIHDNPAAALIGSDVISGLNDSCISAILNSLEEIDSVEMIKQFGVTSEYILQVYFITQNYKKK